MVMSDERLRDRLLAKVSHTADGCWLWDGCVDGHGYGLISVEGRKQKTHRVMYRLAHGEPGNLHVLHRCDRPACINPDHLFLGSHKRSMEDRADKNRGGDLRGEHNGW